MTAFFLSFVAALLLLGYVIGTPSMGKLPTAPTPNPTPKTTPPAAAGVTFGYKSDGSLTGEAITQDQKTWPGNDAYDDICTAVALAEGYEQGLGTAPYDLNNPGDLSPGDEHGQPTCGAAQFHGGSQIIFFCTVEAGWTALRTKFTNIVAGASREYAASDSWAIVAAKYAGNSAAWVKNVTDYLGVEQSSTPADYVAAKAAA